MEQSMRETADAVLWKMTRVIMRPKPDQNPRVRLIDVPQTIMDELLAHPEYNQKQLLDAVLEAMSIL